MTEGTCMETFFYGGHFEVKPVAALRQMPGNQMSHVRIVKMICRIPSADLSLSRKCKAISLKNDAPELLLPT